MDPDPAERLCAWCSEPFTPRQDEQRYCRKSHAAKARHKRQRGEDPVIAPLLTRSCSWCCAAFETRDPRQLYCLPAHRDHAVVCDRKEDFLTEEAVAMAARIRTVPGLRVIEYYRCPRPGDAHWHLRRDKRSPENWLVA